MTLRPSALAAHTEIESVSLHRQWSCDTSRIMGHRRTSCGVLGRTRTCMRRFRKPVPSPFGHEDMARGRGDVRGSHPPETDSQSALVTRRATSPCGTPDRNRTDTFRLKGGDPEPLDDGGKSVDRPSEEAVRCARSVDECPFQRASAAWRRARELGAAGWIRTNLLVGSLRTDDRI